MTDLQQAAQPLNPTLYFALRERFGKVKLANEHASMCGANFPHPFIPGRQEYVVSSWGEYYRIDCPFCGDRKQRLWINHLYGQPHFQSGWPETWLAACYNENCTSHPARRQELERQIFGFRNWQERRRTMVIEPGEDLSGPMQMAVPPGEIMRLSELNVDHPARQYLVGRSGGGFDPIWLYDNFRLGFVLNVDDPRYFAARGRIYIPVYFEGALVGWQTRMPYDSPKGANGPPKYYTMPGMPRRRILYNYDVARHWPFVVAVEGCPSVWRIGGPSVALFGKTLTPGQQHLLLTTWVGKPIVLLLDPDAREEMEGILGELQRAARQPIIPLYLPPGYDPADYPHSTGVNMIRAAAAAAGVELPVW